MENVEKLAKRLRHCPFCGCEAKFAQMLFSVHYIVTCTNEDCDSQSGEASTPELAMNIWNKRAIEKQPHDVDDYYANDNYEGAIK